MSNVRNINRHIDKEPHLRGLGFKRNRTLEDMVSKSYTVSTAPHAHLELQVDLSKARGQVNEAARLLSNCLKNAEHLSMEWREGIAGIDSALHELRRDITNLSDWAERELEQE